MTTEPEVASRKVLMSPELIEQMATRTARGELVTYEWGEPDVDGFYTPTFTVHADDKLLTLADVERALWDMAHRFDANAIASGRCAIGVFPSCHHKMPDVHHTLEDWRRHIR